MNSGGITFQVANGDTYDRMKTHPAWWASTSKDRARR